MTSCMGITQSLILAIGDRTNPSVVWLKYDLNINKNGIFAIQLNFLYFFIVKNDHGTFFDGRLRCLLRLNRFCILYSRTRRQNENLAFLLQLNITEQSLRQPTTCCLFAINSLFMDIHK